MITANLGPAFCQRSIDFAPHTIASIPILHRVMPAIQERHADNMATLMAGYWVATHRGTIMSADAEKLVEEFSPMIERQAEDAGESDTMNCLNHLLAFQFRTADADLILGDCLSGLLYVDKPNEFTAEEIRNFGIKLEGNGFLVATSHRGLEQVFRGTRWEGGLWGSALERWPGARATPQRRFGTVRSRAIWLPRDAVPDPGPSPWRTEKNF